MKVARLILVGFAIVAIALILQHWKKQEGEAARRALSSEYDIQVDRFGDETHIGITSLELINLKRLSHLISKAEVWEDGTPLQPDVLDLTGNQNLTSLAGAEKLYNLRSINAVDCPQLHSATGLAGLPLLTEVRLTDNPKLVDVSAIRDLPSLVTVDFSNCRGLSKVNFKNLPKFKNLYLSSCHNLKTLEVSEFPGLVQLYVDNCGNLSGIDGLGSMRKLTDLDISNCNKIVSLDGLENLESLEVFCLRGVEIKDFSVIGGLPNLITLRLGGQAELTSLEPFSKLTKLSELHMQACPGLTSLKGIPSSVSQYAGFVQCVNLKNIDGLEVAQNLQELDLGMCRSVSDLSKLKFLPKLERLSLIGCRLFNEVEQLENNQNLRFVRLGGSGVVPAKVKPLQKKVKEAIFDFSETDVAVF